MINSVNQFFTHQNIRKYLVFGLSTFILIPESVGLILAILIGVIGVKEIYPLSNKTIRRFLVLSFSLPFIYFVSVIISDNYIEALTFFIRSLLIFLLGVIFTFLPNWNFNFRFQFKVELILFFSALLKIVLNLPQTLSANGFWDFRDQVEQSTDIHGTYWAIFFGLIGIISLYKWTWLKIFQWQYLFMFIASTLLLIMINSKMPLIAFTLVVLVILLCQLTLRTILISGIILIGTLILLYILPFTYVRFYQELAFGEIAIPNGIYSINFKDISSIDTRYAIYKCCYSLIRSMPLFGYGAGDVQLLLNECYFYTYNTDLFLIKKFNSHSQYLGMTLSNGYLGILLFLLFHAYLLLKSFLIKNYLGVMLTIYFLLVFSTENVLDRHFGMFIYSYFIAFYIIRKIINND